MPAVMRVMVLNNVQKSFFAEHCVLVRLTFDLLDIKCRHLIIHYPIRHLCDIWSELAIGFLSYGRERVL